MVDGNALEWPVVQCCTGHEVLCECGADERPLRAYARGDALPSMTVDQRDWCLQQIGQMEGYSVADYAHADDRVLASGVINAWTDYCRDKGLLP